MLLNHLKQAIRSLAKNKVFTAFNIIGFAIGFTVCITIALYVYDEATVNGFIPNAENSYRLENVVGETHYFDNEIAPVLKEQFPEIEDITTMFYWSDPTSTIPVSIGNRQYEIQHIISTNSEFFHFMGIDLLLTKQENPFPTRNSIIISKSTALKTFGHLDIIDETVNIFGAIFLISAVADDIPGNATFESEIYLSDEFDDFNIGQYCIDNDCYLSREIYIKTGKLTDSDQLLEKINSNFPENRSKTETVSLQGVKSIYYATPFSDDSYKAGNKKMLWLFISIAALTLFMSVFNYVNYTISKQFKTLKETGIRITAGAQTRNIRGYYVSEATLSIAAAFSLSLLFTSMALPVSNSLLNASLMLNRVLKPEVIAILIILLLTVIALSVWFPVSMISRSDVNTLLGKNPKRFRANSLSRLMTILQLTIAMILLSALLIINKQLHYVKTASYGFATNQLLRVFLPVDIEATESGSNNYKVIKDEFSRLPFIKNLTLTSYSPGSGGWVRNSAKKPDGEVFFIYMVYIDDNFISTYDMRLLAGREPMPSELNNALLISESALKLLEWDSIEGGQLNELDVVGVVNDMNYNSMHTAIIPLAFYYTDLYYDAVNLQLLPGNFNDQVEQLEAAWQRAGITEPIRYEFYSDYYQRLYQKEEREAQAISIFSIVAFVITCIGLLVQVMQTSERRVKEIGIRKINGATTRQVVLMLMQNYTLWVGIAFVIATPIAWYAMSRWLESFAYKTTLSWWVFALTGLLSLMVALLTVSWQSWRAATRNPVEALRYE